MTSMDELHRIVSRSVQWNAKHILDPGDAYEAAWGSCAELLLTSPDCTPKELQKEAKSAIWRMVRERAHTLGYRDNELYNGPWSSPSSVTYWIHQDREQPSWEDSLLEKVAFAQVWTQLSPTHKDALVCLATYQDNQESARALGMSLSSFKVLVGRARKAFSRLWFDWEQPARQGVVSFWKTRPRSTESPCGTEAAALRHQRRRELLDSECEDALNERRHRNKLRERERRNKLKAV